LHNNRNSKIQFLVHLKQNFFQTLYAHSRIARSITITGVKIWNKLISNIKEISAKHSIKKIVESPYIKIKSLNKHECYIITETEK